MTACLPAAWEMPPKIEPQICMECDGSGLEADSGEGWWEQCDCVHCDGSGYLPIPADGWTLADELARRADAENDCIACGVEP